LFDAGAVPRANDTSVGVGYAPLSETERIVRGIESELRGATPAVGEDVKVMAWRSGDDLRLTVAAAVVSRHVADIDEYVTVEELIGETVRRYATERTTRTVHVGTPPTTSGRNASTSPRPASPRRWATTGTSDAGTE
jgi:S-adenosylmethionine synthetase